MKQVAVISAQHDAHIPFVEKHLEQPFIRIDPQHLLDAARLSFAFEDNTYTVRYNGADITNLRGIWYRKPQLIRAADLPVKPEFREYSRHAIERLSRQLLTAFPKSNWLSDYFTQTRANNKTLQLQMAQTCGFNVPPTLCTSDKAAAAAFIKKHGTCISKPLSATFPKINGQQTVLMSTLVGGDFVPDLSELHLAPTIFQKAIDVASEARVTVVGNQVFAATVRLKQANTGFNAHLEGRIRDNRSRHHEDESQIAAIELPKDLSDRCVMHCKMLDMAYGALDLICDTAGVWWFLENNPNGQWAYIEAATGLPIGKSIANYLQR